jgi:protein Tex
MLLEGVVTNVAAFGAFVDVGVHQDGLVHVSAMSKAFVSDPRDVVKPGDVVRVKVLDVDVPRKRISLTLRLDDDPAGRAGRRPPPDAGRRDRERAPGSRQRQGQRRDQPPDTAMADAFRRAGLDQRPDRRER